MDNEEFKSIITIESSNVDLCSKPPFDKVKENLNQYLDTITSKNLVDLTIQQNGSLEDKISHIKNILQGNFISTGPLGIRKNKFDGGSLKVSQLINQSNTLQRLAIKVRLDSLDAESITKALSNSNLQLQDL